MKILFENKGIEIERITKKIYRVYTIKKLMYPSIELKTDCLTELLKVMREKFRFIPKLRKPKTKYWSMEASIRSI